jgi:CHAT domain-containing protein/tetratricopeptide (TPR) repeat protein
MTGRHRKPTPRGKKHKSVSLSAQVGAIADEDAGAEGLVARGFDALAAGDTEAAAVILVEALKLAPEDDLSLRAVIFCYLGLVHRQIGAVVDAENAFKLSINLARQASMPQCALDCQLFLGEMFKETGKHSAAGTAFEAAFQIAAFMKEAQAMELSAGNVGACYLNLCKFETASDWFTTALTIAESSQSERISLWLGSLGLAMSEVGQWEKSVDWYRRAYLEAQRVGDQLTMSICCGSEGNVRFEQKQFEEAAALFERAKEVSSSIDRRREGIWLGNLGLALSRLNRMDEAISSIKDAISLARQLGDDQSQAAHLDSLGDCYKACGQAEKSAPLYEEALALARGIADKVGERIYLSNLGKVKAEAGELTPAFEFFASACNLFDEQRGAIKSDDLKTSFGNKGQELYRDTIATCLKMDKRVEALEYVGRAKSRALLDLLSNSPIDVSDLAADDAGVDAGVGAGIEGLALSQLVSREADLRAQIAKFERLYWNGEGPSAGGGPGGAAGSTRGASMAQEDTTRLYGEWRDVLNQLRRRHPNYANLISASTLTFSQVKALWTDNLIGDDTCLIEFYFPKEYLLVSAVTAESKSPTNHVILEDEALDTLREDLATFLEMSSTEGWEVPLSLCKRLYKKLLGPIIETLPATVNRLLLVPHASLYHLPFSALHDGTGFLCERFSVSYVPTTSLIPILSHKSEESTGGASGAHIHGGGGDNAYLVSAISDYSATRTNGVVFSSRLRSAAGLEDLGYTMEEAQNIASLGKGAVGATTLITNDEVKESLPKMFGQYEVVHFAGHAVFNADEPMASGLVLADGSILSAASILEGNALRTSRGRLLVLSACQTGVNVVTDGGEILGLARALMYAGMPNLVLSLWEVADRSTADLMQDFHTCWQSGQVTIAEALRQAQLKAIAAKQPVHAWAPFIHFGIE